MQFVKQLMERGNRVFAGVRNPDNAQELLKLKANSASQLSILELDVAESDSCGDWARQIAGSAGQVDVRSTYCILNQHKLSCGLMLRTLSVTSVFAQDVSCAARCINGCATPAGPYASRLAQTN